MDKKKLLNHGADLAYKKFTDSPFCSNSDIYRDCMNQGFKAAVELLWPLIETLEELSKPVDLDSQVLERPLENMTLASEALADLEKELK